MKAAALLILGAVACGGAEEIEKQHVASVSFDMLGSWHRHDVTQRGRQTAEWQPESNDRHEALTIVRTELSPQVARADAAYLRRLLAQAQSSLPQVHVSEVAPIVTANGLAMETDQALANVRSFRAMVRLLREETPVLPILLTLLASVPCKGTRIHDANLVATAMAHRIERIVTLNVGDFAPFAAHIQIDPP